MYRFQINVVTQPGETIALLGSTPEAGEWDLTRCVQLQTSNDRYPLWSADIEFEQLADESGDRSLEYKYVKIGADGDVEWEEWGKNRWVPIETNLPATVIVDDGWFSSIPPFPYGYFAEPVEPVLPSKSPDGLKIVVLGSSVAMGCSAWLLRGWAWQLGQELHRRYGHQLVNVSQLGANVSTTIDRFHEVVAPEQPDIVIIALSLGNEGFASTPVEQQRAIQQHFEEGLQQLIRMTQEIGARPILGDVYPNGDYTPQHYALLRETHQRMQMWGVPVLDWLAVLDDGQGRWKSGISFDAAHPNSEGHRRMFEAIALDFFCPAAERPLEKSIFQDNFGFRISLNQAENSLQIHNASSHSYTIAPYWKELQTAVQTAKPLTGLYFADTKVAEALPSLFISSEGTIETTHTVSSHADHTFYPVCRLFAGDRSQLLFYNGSLGILKVSDRQLYVINESDHEYNVHPMWSEVRAALKAMPSGVYEDPHAIDAPFRTMMIGRDGLESRVKAPARSVLLLEYQCSLEEVSRVAIVPLGDRCAARMLLYKLEYDGPAFPFDLTRTTKLADVSDMIRSEFRDMWNPNLLHYNHDEGRIYHAIWSGLSFAHEIEESDNPEHDMSPVHQRMRTRYTARAKRFEFTLTNSDKVLFIRTGVCDRAAVTDLICTLETKLQGKPFRLLLISPQNSSEFANLPDVIHYDLDFNPDRMYEDLGFWMECTETMRSILNALGISSKNLFWCPPSPPAELLCKG